MPISEERTPNSRHGGDALGAMYVLAAFLFSVAALVIVILLFVARSRPLMPVGPDAWTPGSSTPWVPPPALEKRIPAGLTQISPGHYVAVIEATNWEFYPAEIHLPVGSEVTFRVRSREDYHGFAISGTSILLSLKQVASKDVTRTFPVAGEFPIFCSEYCGYGHSTMTGRVVVE